MKRAKRVRKARMFSRLIGEMRQPELFYPPQTLELSRVNQPNQKPSFVRIGFEANNIMNRIAVYFFRQFFAPDKENSPQRAQRAQRKIKTGWTGFTGYLFFLLCVLCVLCGEFYFL
jgi:hypothetical protein